MSDAVAPRSTPATLRAARRKRGAFFAYFSASSLLALVFTLPLVWVVMRSLQPSSLGGQAPQTADFTHLTGENYRAVFTQEHILVNVSNSLITGISTALLTTFVATLSGYGLARFRFRGSGVVFALMLVALMIPFQAVLTPLFLELNYLHLTNSLLGLVLIYTTFNLPFGVFVMRNAFQQIPRELLESAQVDGSGVVGTLLRVLRPLVMATTAIYAFLFSWTEFLQALTFLQSDNKLTLPVKLFNIDTSTYGAINYGYLSSGIVIAMVPCIVLYLALQRYYVQGLISGAVKG
jgi:multiple sugar transport system permease protein